MLNSRISYKAVDSIEFNDLHCGKIRTNILPNREFHYENMSIQTYRKFYLQKLKIFRQKKNSHIFHISAQNIDCGYSLELPQQGSSNEHPQSMVFSRNKKYTCNVYPCKPQFYYIKVGLKGVILNMHVFVMQNSLCTCSLPMVFVVHQIRNILIITFLNYLYQNISCGYSID